MPKFESSGAKREVPNVWGNEGDFAAGSLPEVDEIDFKVVTKPPVPPAANQAPFQPRHEVRRNVESDPNVVDALLGDANFGIAESPTSISNPSDRDPMGLSQKQVETIGKVFTNDRDSNLGLVKPREGTLATPTEGGVVKGDIKRAEVLVDTPSPRTAASTNVRNGINQASAQPKKSFIKRLFGIN